MTPDAAVRLFARTLIGLAIGADSAIATASIAEYAPKNRRGSLAMLQQWTITVGILVAYMASRRRSEACPSWPWCCSARRWQVRAARPDGPPRTGRPRARPAR